MRFLLHLLQNGSKGGAGTGQKEDSLSFTVTDLWCISVTCRAITKSVFRQTLKNINNI